VGSGGTSVMVTGDSEKFRLENLESEIIEGAWYAACGVGVCVCYCMRHIGLLCQGLISVIPYAFVRLTFIRPCIVILFL